VGGELPGEVGGVLDAGVHADAAGGEVVVGGVPGEEDPGAAVPRGQAGGVAVAGKPDRVAQGEAGPGDGDDVLAQFVQGEVAGPGGGQVAGPDADQAVDAPRQGDGP